MVLGPIFMILIVVGIVAGIIYLLRLFGVTVPAASSHATHDRTLALLKERYAKGEIDTTEFSERKKLLSDCSATRRILFGKRDTPALTGVTVTCSVKPHSHRKDCHGRSSNQAL